MQGSIKNSMEIAKKRITPARVAFTEIETTLRRFFMRVTCRGFAGTQANARTDSLSVFRMI